ncbi:MAG TPA: response regulator, partial [Polyangiaceae bacterium]
VHHAGMAHCDVKPANVMLAPAGRIVLTDFGIFRPESEIRHDGVAFGSPHYMAPETAACTVQPGELFLVDVYALGVVAYELLTTAVPYDHRSAMAVMGMHLTEPIPDPRALRPDTPPRLAALVKAMLAKDPKNRPQSTDEVAWQLRWLGPEAMRRHQAACSVLVVEDNAATAAIIASLVTTTAPEADVRIAGDGRTALALMQDRAADLLVVDLHLPGTSGVELCRQLAARSLVGRCLVVATSSHASLAELEGVRSFGFVRFMAKGEELMRRLPALVQAARWRTGRPTRV